MVYRGRPSFVPYGLPAAAAPTPLVWARRAPEPRDDRIVGAAKARPAPAIDFLRNDLRSDIELGFMFTSKVDSLTLVWRGYKVRRVASAVC